MCTKKLKDKEWLHNQYVTKKLTVYEIADMIDCGKTTVCRYLNRYGIVTYKNKSQEDRFWDKVNKIGRCWFWTASTNGRGYGQIGIDGKMTYVHRYSYELHKGTIPEGLFVCHTCDNPSCVNPDHLFVGSQIDNMQDCISKGRSRSRGENSGSNKLTEKEVLEIRKLYKTGDFSHKQLAEKFVVTKANIGMIVNRGTWKHI